MFRLIAASLLASLCLSVVADAQERTRLGYGRLITNDYIGGRQGPLAHGWRSDIAHLGPQVDRGRP